MLTLSSETPFHPSYGFADETRWTILRDAEIFGVRAAAEMHGVHPASIRRWRRAYSAAAHQADCPAVDGFGCRCND